MFYNCWFNVDCAHTATALTLIPYYISLLCSVSYYMTERYAYIANFSFSTSPNISKDRTRLYFKIAKQYISGLSKTNKSHNNHQRISESTWKYSLVLCCVVDDTVKTNKFIRKDSVTSFACLTFYKCNKKYVL